MAAALRARFSRVPKERAKSNTLARDHSKTSTSAATSVSTNREAKKATEQPRSHAVSHSQKKKSVTSGGDSPTKELLSPAALQMWEKQVINWNFAQVSSWLTTIGQAQHIPLFKKENISGSRMLEDSFTSNYLQSLGVDKDAANHIIAKLQEECFNQSIAQHCPMLPAEDISYPSSDSLHPTELGRGGFGVVLLGLYRVAVKRLLNVTDTGELRSLQNEINLLSSPQHKHKNLIRLIGISSNLSSPMLVLEYMKRGDLGKLLRDKKCLEVEWLKRGRQIVTGIAEGLHFLHSQTRPIVHRDLKPSNVLIDESWVPKIADVGLARIRATEAVEATKPICSPPWAAPEILQNLRYTEKCDVFSFGVLLWQVVTRQTPWEGLTIDEIRIQVLSGERLDARSVPRSIFTVLRRCWLTNAQDRADMNTVKGLIRDIDETQKPDPEATTFRYEAISGFEGQGKKVINNNLTINMGNNYRERAKANAADGERENTLILNVGGIGPDRKEKERTGPIEENNGIVVAGAGSTIGKNDGQVVQVNAPSAADQLLSLKNNMLQALKIEDRDTDVRFLDEFCASYGPNVGAFQLSEIAEKFDDTTLIAELQRSITVNASDHPVVTRLLAVLKILVRLDGNALHFTANRGLEVIVRYNTMDTESAVLVELFSVLANLCGIPKCRSAIAKSTVADKTVIIALKHPADTVRMRAMSFLFYFCKDEKRRPIVASQLDSVTEEEVAQFVRHSASQKEVMSQFCSTMESLSNLREAKAFLMRSRRVFTDLAQQQPDLAPHVRLLLNRV